MTDRTAPDDDLPTDDELTTVVREAFPPIPPEVLAAAKATFTWRTVDAELAELLEGEVLAVRSGTADPAVAYVAGDVVIDVERAGAVVLGQVADEGGGSPAGQAPVVVVEVAGSDGTRRVVEADVDGAGAFRAPVPPGQARVAVTMPDGRRIVTPWLPS